MRMGAAGEVGDDFFGSGVDEFFRGGREKKDFLVGEAGGSSPGIRM